jgi:mitochondrial fission protein ELM1
MRLLVVSDGRRGIENQALGLAEAMARERPAEILRHTVSHGPLLRALPPKLQQALSHFDHLPACEIAIGCGRQAIAPLLWLKKYRPKVWTIYVQDPRISPHYFNQVVAPDHDAVSGPNVISMLGSPNRVTAQTLETARARFADKLDTLTAPRATLLIGGTSKRHRLDAASHAAQMDAAEQLLTAGYHLMVSTSRRTPDSSRQAWQEFAAQDARIWLHDGHNNAGEANPYFAFLAAADVILVTEDSTNMLTEACATGTPVYRLPMAGSDGKFAQLYTSLEDRCGVQRFTGQLTAKTYSPLDETTRAARAVWQAYGQP